MIQSEKLLQQECTLTIVTNPVSAICTINYNGIDYTTKSLSVPSGTTVSYSIYHETYGTQTGTIFLDTNKTINAEGTYSVGEPFYVIPGLSANSSTYGACTGSGWGNSNYYTFTTTYVTGTFQATPSWTMTLSASNHIPAGVAMDFTIGSRRVNIGNGNYYARGIKITYTYTDSTTEVVWNSNTMFSKSGYQTVTGTCSAASKEVSKVLVNFYKYNAAYSVIAGVFNMYYNPYNYYWDVTIS